MKPLLSFFVLIFYIVVAVPQGNRAYELTEADYRGLSEIIGAEDNPQMLAQYLGDHDKLVADVHFRVLLSDAVRHHRPESFKALFARAALGRDDHWPMPILQEAANLHRFEICNFLLENDFRLGTLFAAFGLPPRRFRVDDFRPDIAQLRELARLHPDKVQLIGPHHRWLEYIADAQCILFLIDFIAYCRTISLDYAEHRGYQPSTLLRTVLRNEILDDAGMAQVIDRLVHLGAGLEAGPWEAFRQGHPEQVQALNALNAALIIEQDIKEPEGN
jgi:hypothetical protein